MRTIKFRAKMSKTREWVFGSLIRQQMRGYKDSFCVLILDNVFTSNRIVAIDKETVGQFTGLTDKNGKEIYEGDILLWTRKKVHIDGRPLQDFSNECKVYYDNDKCGFRFRCELSCGACTGFLDFSDDRADESYIEVIGNIHDNPELLEEGGDK